MKKTLPWLRLVLLTVLSLGTPATAAGGEPLHFDLARSSPADGASVHEVTEVKLWFTQAPAEGTVSIRIIAPDGEPVVSTDPVPDEADPTAYVVTPSAPLAPGSYRVTWRGMGADGHVVRGEISFAVMAH